MIHTAAASIVSLNTALTAAGSNVVASADGAGIKFVDSTGANITVSGTSADLNTSWYRRRCGAKEVHYRYRPQVARASRSVRPWAAAAASNTASGFTTNSATSAVTTLTTAVSAIDISTAAGGTLGIAAIDGALDTINSTRATLGSYQSRFDSIVASSLTTSENLSASRSRIMDADFAQETAQLTKAQILQQSGIAMLAQANSIPQNVLALLQ